MWEGQHIWRPMEAKNKKHGPSVSKVERNQHHLQRGYVSPNPNNTLYAAELSLHLSGISRLTKTHNFRFNPPHSQLATC